VPSKKGKLATLSRRHLNAPSTLMAMATLEDGSTAAFKMKMTTSWLIASVPGQLTGISGSPSSELKSIG
jgi:hypothetical protein